MPGRYETPGVYYKTLGKTPGKPAFRTGVPVFIGFAKTLDSPLVSGDNTGIRHIERWQQFVQWYVPTIGGYLSYAVHGFFQNGGEHCVVLPIQRDPANSSPEDMIKSLIDVFGVPEKPGVLDDMEGIDLVCVPDAMFDAVRQARSDATRDIQSAALEHCRRMGDRFAILDSIQNGTDAPGTPNTSSIDDLVEQWRSLPPEHGALYFPWIHVTRALPKPDLELGAYRVGARRPCEAEAEADFGRRLNDTASAALVPPCGHIAGVYSQTDRRVGVHKAPANEVLEGVFGLGVNLSDKEQATLNNLGINCLRSLAGRGIRVWGARTLSGQPAWRYVNVRRLFLTLTRWIRQNMNDLVYEGNTPALWGRVADRLHGYCLELYDRGALMGSSPAEAFFIKCDEETNPRESWEAGLVVTDVGLAPAVPAEFVVVRITQSASAVTVTGGTVS
jgi:hypothetical protein